MNHEHERIAGYDYKEWEELCAQFEKDLANSKKYNKSFSELIDEILEGDTAADFEEKTELSPNMLSRLKRKSDETNPPQKSTIISICVGYKLDLMMAQALFYSVGSGLNRRNKTDYAYSFLLTRCRDKDIYECNEILRELGVRDIYLLGSHVRRPRQKRK